MFGSKQGTFVNAVSDTIVMQDILFWHHIQQADILRLACEVFGAHSGLNMLEFGVFLCRQNWSVCLQLTARFIVARFPMSRVLCVSLR